MPEKATDSRISAFKSETPQKFKSDDNRLIFRFAMTYAIIYAVNVASLKMLLLADVDLYYGNAVLIVPMAVLAYVLNRRFVFTNA